MKIWWNHDKQFTCPFILKKMGTHDNKIARYLTETYKNVNFYKTRKTNTSTF